ncbi:MAG: SMP-30/gluconolactonase/LRE family protein [Chloroflexi bacterium]|nr:SMP-30/gluconolactonase/LRE family protein [Chloroflexota bacterium]MDA1001783.1 SMP-30/gluconolactonase/LRE family protein [Chloroflexota bacterium]
MRIENDDGLSALLTSKDEKKLCTGFTFTEGPLWIASDNALLFSDIPGNRTHRWRPGMKAAEVYREPSGFANGLAIDARGTILACEHGGRRVSRSPYVPDGPSATPTVLVDRYDGKRLNSPNDIVVHSSGAIYFTDPTYGLPRPGAKLVMGEPHARQELHYQGVYRTGPDGSFGVIIQDFTQPNGLAFSPDESVLYIGDSQDRIIRRYTVQPDGSLRGGDVFVDMSGDERPGVPDGMKVDEDGRLWTTGAGGVWVITAEGKPLGVFECDEHAANIAFGGAKFSTLFLTAQTSVYSVETKVRGIGPGSRK